jgi:uncharacterized membrane protein YidH (DUF202 family)
MPRVRLAATRTLLAWWRTGLGLTGMGITLGKLFTEQDTRFVGFVLVLLGFLFSMLSVARYQRTMALLQQGKYSASRWSILVCTAATVTGLVLIIIFRSIYFPLSGF